MSDEQREEVKHDVQRAAQPEVQPDKAQAELREEFKMVKVIYVLFLLALLFPVTGLVGVIMAHVSAGESGGPALSHFRFQYRTFWIGLLGFVVGALTAYVMVGFLLLAVVGLWWIIRCAHGLVVANKRNPMTRPERLGF